MNIRCSKDTLGRYRRVVNMLIVVVVPATGTAIASLPAEVLDERQKVIIGIVVSWLLALLKGFQQLLEAEAEPADTEAMARQEEKVETIDHSPKKQDLKYGTKRGGNF